MKQLSPARQRLLAVVVPIVVVVAVVWFGVWRPRAAEESSLQTRREQIEGQISRVRAQLSSATAFREDGEAADRLAAARAALPDDSDISEFIRLNDELAGRSGVVVESLTPAPLDSSKRNPSTPTGTQDNRVAISLVGSPTSTVDYLHGLATLPRRVVIDDMTSTASGDGVRLNLDLRIFHEAPTGFAAASSRARPAGT